MARGDVKLCQPVAGDSTSTSCGAKAVLQAGSPLHSHADENENELQNIDEFLAGAAEAPADCGSAMELPPWFQWDKFRRGQAYFYRNMYALFVAKLAGLISVLAVPSILRVLVFTRMSSDDASAFRRYTGTLLHMCDWYKGDLLEPTSKAYKSLSNVRSKHAAAARRSGRAGLGGMSQRDMLLTQFGFMGFALLSPGRLGTAPASPEDIEGFLHFWRTIGHFLGIEDRYNICRGDEAQTRALCRAIRDHVFKPALQHPPAQFGEMSRALVSGMRCIIPSLDYDAFLRFITSDLLHIEEVGKLSNWSRFILGLQRFVNRWLLQTFLTAWIVRAVLNANMRLAVYLTGVYPFLAYWKFGRENSVPLM